MKTPEEIEKWASKYADGYSTDEAHASYIAFIDGYTQCQQDNAHMQFTMHDMVKAIELAREGSIGYHAPESPAFYFDKTEDEIIQSVKTNE
jgi:hypothetical protein